MSDNFNRADEYCPGDLCIHDNTLQVLPDHFAVGSNYIDWYTGVYPTTFLGNVSILSRNADTYSGIGFWDAGSAIYRVGELSAGWGQRVYLEYDTYDAMGNLESTTGLGNSASNLPPGPGKLTVDANSSTRRIKVYWNGVLQIDFTETDTSRPNSGGATLFDWGGGYAVLDDLLLEQ